MSDELNDPPMSVGAPSEAVAPTKKQGWPKGKPRKTARASSEVAARSDAPKPTVQVTSRRNSALERRLSPGANPHASGTKHIPLREPKRWHLYIANDYAGGDELYRMRHELGWEPLAPEDLACKPEEIGFRISETGDLVRGPQGREVVFKMDAADYALLAQRKTEKNNIGIGKPSVIKQQIANAAANTFGDEAGEFANRHITGTVTDTVEVIR